MLKQLDKSLLKEKNFQRTSSWQYPHGKAIGSMKMCFGIVSGPDGGVPYIAVVSKINNGIFRCVFYRQDVGEHTISFKDSLNEGEFE